MVYSESVRRQHALELKVHREVEHLIEIAGAVQSKDEFLARTRHGISNLQLSRETKSGLVYEAKVGKGSQTLGLFFVSGGDKPTGKGVEP
jgi:hypothetical protein